MKLLTQIRKAIIPVLYDGVKRATVYDSPKLVIKATFQGKRRKYDLNETILVTIGKPNYAERHFIKTARAAKEPFPIKKAQLKFAKAA